jgi:predicted nicotinamide N-methyase
VNKPHQDTTHHDSTTPALSRRSVLQTAAGAGLAATAVTALGAATASVANASAANASAAGTSTSAGTTSATTAGPLVVHVRDIKSGDIEVFSGTEQTRVRDRALAARIAQAIS